SRPGRGGAPASPHHPGPLLPASPPPAGRRGRTAKSSLAFVGLPAPLSPGRWGGGRERGAGGVRVRPEGALCGTVGLAAAPVAVVDSAGLFSQAVRMKHRMSPRKSVRTPRRLV